MQGNSRFAVGVHALALATLAQERSKGRPVTSNAIAATVGVHPVHVRRVMGALREAGLVASQSGPSGGWELTIAAAEISLYDIYVALESDLPFALPTRVPEACCRFAPSLPQTLAETMDSAREVLQQHLRGITLEQILARTNTCIASTTIPASTEGESVHQTEGSN